MNKQLSEKEKLAEAFALKIIELEKFLREKKKEHRMSDQVFRAGTSIGANIAESVYAESTADFIHKLGIALKEANETLYWLRLLFSSNYISNDCYNSLSEDCLSLIKLLISIIRSTKKNSNSL